MELATGRTRWRYFCGGPVRFAPAADETRVFVGADDGLVHALSLETGTPVWTARIGPDRALVSGNGRLISPCPIRTGLLVSEGVVYVAAGLFPLEGTYLAALDARDGQLRWRRTLGAVSPQGYLANAGSEIVVPLGRASPKIYRRKDGAYIRDVPSASGTFAVVAGDETLSGPGPTGSIQSGNARTGAKLVSYPGRQMAVTPRMAYLVNGLELVALDRQILRESRGSLEKARRWRADCGGGAALMVASGRVYAGASDRVEVLDADTGALRQTLEVSGPVTSLAADAQGLVVATRQGSIHAFLARSHAPVSTATPSPSTAKATVGEPQGVPSWLKDLPSTRGLVLWVAPEIPWSALGGILADSELQVALALPATAMDSGRRALADAGWLGTRVSVITRCGDGSVPVVDHLFNAVVAGDLSESEAVRLACPGPSGLVIFQDRIIRPAADPAAGTWTHLYGNAANVCASAQSLTGFPRLQWFGGHGPERMPDRHTRGHAPLAAGGLMVSMAENALIATDARNGTVRWTLELPDSMRYVMPYDGGYAALREDGGRAFVAVDESLWEIETRQGGVLNRIRCPVSDRHWGWVALDGDALFGSAEDPRAPRTRKEFELVDLDYRSERPLVCSQAVFRAGRNGTTPEWIRTTDGAFVNATLCASQGRVYAVEARGSTAVARREGRLTCAEILESAFVVCWDSSTGRTLWEKPLRWAEAKDILGLAVSGNRLVLSAAQSAGNQASYHLRCWSAADGSELWQSRGLNPIQDLYHGQQVKRPVVLRDKVSFESNLFDLATGERWTPPGAPAGWILSRPGHACGGMTGAGDGLLFRADNPTFFRLADGSFTRLSPTRPGCWLNILPADGGVLIPEASASCICEYPIQTSMAFAWDREPVPVLPDVVTVP